MSTHPEVVSVAEQKTPYFDGSPRLLDRLREALRSRHYSRRTEQTYCQWVRRFIFFHNVRHPAEMSEAEINAFLTHLNVIRARKPARLPVVMTRDEVRAVLSNLSGDKWLMASLMYGAGLRLMECLRLRVQDIDFSRNEILVRDGKGAKDRITMLPESLRPPLLEHLKKVMAIHERDLSDGWGRLLPPKAYYGAEFSGFTWISGKGCYAVILRKRVS